MKKIGDTIQDSKKIPVQLKNPIQNLDELKKQYETMYINQTARDQDGSLKYKIEIDVNEQAKSRNKTADVNISRVVIPCMLLPVMDMKTKRLGPDNKIVRDNGNTIFRFGMYHVYEIDTYTFKTGLYQGKSFRYLKRVDKFLTKAVA